MKNLYSTITPECEEFLYLEPKAREEVKDFIPTRHELIQIVKFWYKQVLGNAWDFFVMQSSGSVEDSIDAFAQIRINHIREVTGQPDVDRAIAEARHEFSKDVDPAKWQKFIECDESRLEALRKQILRAAEEVLKALPLSKIGPAN